MSKKNKADATRLQAIRVKPADHEEMLEEINRRTELEHGEAEDEEDSEDESEGEESSEGEGGEEDA